MSVHAHTHMHLPHMRTDTVLICILSASSLFQSGSGDQAKNVAVALRCLANMFSSSEGARLMVTCRQHVSGVCVRVRMRAHKHKIGSSLSVCSALDRCSKP